MDYGKYRYEMQKKEKNNGRIREDRNRQKKFVFLLVSKTMITNQITPGHQVLVALFDESKASVVSAGETI